MTEFNPAAKKGQSQAFVHRRFVHGLAVVSLGLGIIGLMAGLTAIPAVDAGAASSINSIEPYAQAQLLKRSNLPPGWTELDKVWVGTSADDNSSRM